MLLIKLVHTFENSSLFETGDIILCKNCGALKCGNFLVKTLLKQKWYEPIYKLKKWAIGEKQVVCKNEFSLWRETDGFVWSENWQGTKSTSSPKQPPHQNGDFFKEP